MLQLPNQQIGDAWFFVHDDTCHAYFLTCPMHVKRHTLWDVGHATSRDLKSWDYLGLCFERAPEPAWDATLATGAVVEWDGRFVMAYTGHRTARVGVALSDDLHHWERLSDAPVTAPEAPHYALVSHGFRTHTHWRDPGLFTHDGFLYHAVCASRSDPPPPTGRHVGTADIDRSGALADPVPIAAGPQGFSASPPAPSASV
ncbi:MAG: hypothetical protein AAF711_02020 [Planctomycetota bacterium]